jgi:hypothetical protein
LPGGGIGAGYPPIEPVTLPGGGIGAGYPPIESATLPGGGIGAGYPPIDVAFHSVVEPITEAKVLRSPVAASTINTASSKVTKNFFIRLSSRDVIGLKPMSEGEPSKNF